jgi:hypothetical protein
LVALKDWRVYRQSIVYSAMAIILNQQIVTTNEDLAEWVDARQMNDVTLELVFVVCYK